jgi:putative ATP-dependent endonuclease of OLD family
VLALEEPEAHLHPNAQRQLCDQLREVPGQLIVSTHSPYIAALAPLEDLRHFAKSGSETHVRSVNVSGLGPEDLRRTQRDVMNTRGELLFARVIVLFEGDTEEQALPVFARHYFQQMPFELGITMVNVGGFGNYKAFLRLAVGMGIPWLIFSDAEVQTKQNVVAQTTGLTGGQVLFLPDGLDFEAYLLQEGYADVIRKAFVTLSLPPGADPRRRQAKEREASGMGTAELTQWLDANKPQAAPLVAESIVSLVDTAHQVPSRIRNMLDTLAGVLGVTGREGS